MSRVQIGINDLKTKYPEIAAEWDSDKNSPLSANEVSGKSHYKVWWICKKGHSWEAMISNRTQHGRGCPYCAHQLPIPGETDFLSVCPDAAKEWHPVKNGMLKPSDFMYGSHKKVWWLCHNCGLEWQAEIKTRYLGSNCPKCGGFRPVFSVDNTSEVTTMRPEVMKYWHPTKNLPKTPADYSFSSSKKVWWICKNGHEYLMSVDNKTHGCNCPICARRRRTSFPEQTIYYYIKQVFPEAINSYKAPFSGSMELDIYIPEIQVGIEYDGRAYHSSLSNINRDIRKYQICHENGIRLIRISSSQDSSLEERCDFAIEIESERKSELEKAIIQIAEHLNIQIIPNINRDKYRIYEYLESVDNSLETEYPEIAKEFHKEKNGKLRPSYFHFGSNERVWWKCSVCDFEWEAQISMRTWDENGCPKCSRRRGAQKKKAFHLKQNGSLAQTHPELLKYWNYDKNTGTDPNGIIAGSTQKVWWICEKGHEWQATLGHINQRGIRCPYCTNRRILTGFNDLSTLKPELMTEWDALRNTEINPCEIGAGTSRKAWWICSKCGHKWYTSINLRTKGCGCPNCDHMRKFGNQYARKHFE